MEEYKDQWNQIHKSYFKGTIEYDNWLDSYLPIIESCSTPIIDLGCGSGNNSLYLREHGKQVIACDYSEEALHIVNQVLKDVQTRLFDMKGSFPFPDHFVDLVIADLCLHYFSYSDTVNIIKEIQRILTPNGHLLLRVNSVHDFNNGAMQGIELEKHYFAVENMKKRFFDQEDLESFFSNWTIVDLVEDQMFRYRKPKVLYRGCIQNKKIDEIGKVEK